jgi:two-component system nitrate/nitrite response regulator NarL
LAATDPGSAAGSSPAVVPLRVLLVDDQPLFRRAIGTLIDEQPDFTVVDEAANGQEGLEKARALRPDLVVMDIEMPVMNGVEAVRLLRDELPEVKVVVLTVSEAEDYLFDAVRYGAHGYLLKNLRPDELYDMLRAVARGEHPISPAIAGRLLEQFRRQQPAPSGSAAPRAAAAAVDHIAPPEIEERNPFTTDAARILTRRELETLQYVADGLSNKEIGVALSITEGTVKNHVHSALEKLQLENRIQAAAYVVRQGFAHRPEPR